MPGAMLVQSIQVRAAARDAERARALLAIYVSTLYAHTAQSLTAIPTIAGRAWPLHRLCTWLAPKGPLLPSLVRCNRYRHREKLFSLAAASARDGGRRETGVCPVMAGGRP